jgi:hypothetical protein
VVLEVIFYESHCEGYGFHVLEEDFGIDKDKVDVLILQIKIVKRIFKSYLNSKIGFIVREVEHIVNRYDVSNGKAEHVTGWKRLIGYP